MKYVFLAALFVSILKISEAGDCDCGEVLVSQIDQKTFTETEKVAYDYIKNSSSSNSTGLSDPA
jgi:hypothetical protein